MFFILNMLDRAKREIVAARFFEISAEAIDQVRAQA